MDAVKTSLANIECLRTLFLQEANTQIRYDAYHRRGWADAYLLNVEDLSVGYGAVKGQERGDRDTIFEYFVIPPFRKWSRALFARLIAATGATCIECQSNDPSLSPMLHEFARDIRADVVLFNDHVVTEFESPGALVRTRRDDDSIFEHTVEPVGDYVVQAGADVVATGGFLRHYHMPFADLHMEVRADRRRQGYGSLLLQEVKKACYLAGRVPAARCAVSNTASRATLTKAGFRIGGYLQRGVIKAGSEWPAIDS